MHKLTHFLADQAKRELDDRDLTSRSDLRRERKQSEKAYADLALALCNCPKKQFERLVLDEPLRQVLTEARRIESPAARDRALRLVRRELRSGDPDAVARQLEVPNQSSAASQPQESEVWAKRLLTEGDEALSDFVQAHPQADRRRLRQLISQSKKPPTASAAKATATLTRCIAEALRATAVVPDRE